MLSETRVRRVVAKRAALVLVAVAALVGVMASSGAALQPPPPPTVTEVSPPNLVKPAPAATNVTATFSEAMRVPSINTTTFKLARIDPDGTTAPVAATVTYRTATRTATLDPAADLEAGTYQATVTIGARDLSDIQLDQNPTQAGNQGKSWRFRVTDAPTPTDTTPPTVTAVTPAQPRPGVHPEVPGTINPTATFSEEMQPKSINSTTVTLVKQIGNVGVLTIEGAVTYDAATKTATFDPAADLEPGIYDARVTIGARDLAGNQLDQKPNQTGKQAKPWRFFVVE